MVGDVRVARGTEEDRVVAAQRRQAVGRHHLAVRAVPVAAPAEGLELEAQSAVGGGERLEQLGAGGDHFLADAVTGDQGDAIGLHAGSREVGARGVEEAA